MKHSFKTQPALFATNDLLDHSSLKALEGIESLINGTVLEPLLPKGEGGTGRPGCAAMTLFWALILGIWHNLFDVKLEIQLALDLMFRKFCRPKMDKGVPQSSTIGHFRIALDNAGHVDAVLTQINDQLCQSKVSFKRAVSPSLMPRWWRLHNAGYENLVLNLVPM
ncbi:MAG: transposase [Halopseudomonas aestusnigri]